MRRVLSFLVLTGTFLAQQPLACATFFDLHNLGNIGSNSKTITVDGISLTLSSGSTLVSTSSRFGIDGIGAADAPDLIDGGNGSPEILSFIFNNNDTYLDSILISEFGGDDVGTVSIKVAPNLTPVSNGVNVINQFVSTSGQSIQWGGANSTAAGRGFSVDGFTVHLVPETSTLLLLGLSLAACSCKRLRRVLKA